MIQAELNKMGYQGEQIHIVNAQEVITMEDSPVKAIRRKSDSSMVVGLNMIKEGTGDVFVSGGNTGALVVGSPADPGKDRRNRSSGAGKRLSMYGKGTVHSGQMPEQARKPRLITCWSTVLWGKHLYGTCVGKKQSSRWSCEPGSRGEQGNQHDQGRIQKTEKSTGLISLETSEAREVPRGACDVIVCDGFVGNVILKLTEGVAMSILELVKSKLMASLGE